MEEFLDILMGIVPAVIVGVVAYLLIDKFLRAESQRHMIEVKKETVKYSIPVRMQAYERMVLLAERIDPVKSVNRVIRPGMTAKQVQQKVLADIRKEFEHNVTQQLYVSKATWEEVKKAKEESLKVLTLTLSKCPDGADAIEYTKVLIQVIADLNVATSANAIEVVRKEARKIF